MENHFINWPRWGIGGKVSGATSSAKQVSSTCSHVHKGTVVRQKGGLKSIALQLRKIKDNFIELSQSSQVTSGMIILPNVDQ